MPNQTPAAPLEAQPVTQPDVRPGPQPAVAATYRDRIAALHAREQTLHRQHLSLGYLRLAFVVAAVALLFLTGKLWALLPMAAFLVAARVHGRVLAQLAGTRRVLAMYEHALARVEDRWAGLHPRPVKSDLEQSLYAADLDLFCPGGLFELLCEARTSLGEDTLAAWLLTPAAVAEIPERNAAVVDLRSRVHLREAFAAAPGPALAVLDRRALAAWAEREDTTAGLWLTLAAPLLLVLLLVAAWFSWHLHSWLPVAGALLLNAALTFFYRRSFASLFNEAQGAARSLNNAASLLDSIQNESFKAPRLEHLQAKLREGARPAARALHGLAALSEWIDARGNYLVRILDVVFLYSVNLAFGVRRWKRRYGTQLGPWLDVLGEFEALLSLAAYSYEHPDDPFAQVVVGPARFDAKGLGHPLLPSATCIRNDVSLGGPAQILLVSGSNMSGKSTLLRSVGTNAVLAFAGAPVRARSLTLSPLAVAASIHKNDSLQAGRSRFYVEILVLRAIAQAARKRPPVLFLIDEVLAGTNSRDRLVGAQGLIKELLRNGAIGMFSTHDLSLTNLGFPGKQAVRNVHFQDTVEDGKLEFDYKLRDGIIERSNGLALMRLIGLEV